MCGSNMTWKKIDQFENFVWFIGLIYYLIFLIYPHEIMGQPLIDDPMSVSGFGLLLAGIFAAKLIQKSFPKKVAMMFSSGAIQSEFPSHSSFMDWFNRIASISFLWVAGSLVPLALIGIYFVDTNYEGKWHLIAGSFLGVWVISTRFAFGVATGIGAAKLSSRESRFVLSPPHPDRSSGFGHLGYFYFEQALVLLLPSVFMVGWILLVSLNMSQLARSELVNQVEALVENRKPSGVQFDYIIDQYVICSSGESDLKACNSREREFIWYFHFIRLITFNLTIFMFIWIIPSIYIYRKMKAFRRRFIDPVIELIEREIATERRKLMDAADTDDKILVADLGQNKIDQLAETLAIYRSTPTFPIPLGTAVTTWVSNVSAILGLLSLG